MARKRPEQSNTVTGTTMLVGLMALVGVVGLVFTLATKDSTLIKDVLFSWLVMVLFLVLVGTYVFKGKVLIPRTKMMLPLGVYVCLCIVWTLLPGYRYASARELIHVSCCGMLLFVAVRAVESERAFLCVAGMLAAVVGLSCLYGILQHYGVDPFFGGETSLPGRERPFSTMGHPNFFASFLILGLPLLLSLFFWSEDGRVKGTLLVLICASAFCLFNTQSRGAWLGYLGALPVWFFFSLGSKRWRSILFVPMLGVMAAMLLLLLSGRAGGYVVLWALPFWLAALLIVQLSGKGRKARGVGKPLWGVALLAAVLLVSNLLVDQKSIGGRMGEAFETEKGSVRTRKIVWAGTLRMAAARPLFGWGNGTFSIHFPRFRDPATAGKIAPNTLHAHSEYLEVASEMGIVGLGVFLWMLAAFAWESVRNVARARDTLQRVAIVGLLAGCTAILLQGAVSVTTRWVVGRFFLWLGMGLAIAAARMSESPGTGRKKKKKEMPEGETERFRAFRIGAVRSPAARAAFILFVVVAGVTAAWWGGRIFASAVSTTRGESFQRAAESLGGEVADETGILRMLDAKEQLRQQATEAYERAIQLNPYNLFAYYGLGHCYNLLRRFDDSLRTYRRMAKLAPDGSDIHFNLGVVYANMRQWEDSKREFEAALSMKIGPLSRLGLARAYENLRLFDKAGKQYQALLRDYPNNVRGINGLARLHLRRGENDDAMKLYREALEIDPEDADAHLGLGLIYQVQGDGHGARGENERARECYEKSLAELAVSVEKRPHNAPSRAALGLVYAQLGRFEEALAELQTARKINPNDPVVRVNLQRVYRMMEGQPGAEADRQ